MFAVNRAPMTTADIDKAYKYKDNDEALESFRFITGIRTDDDESIRKNVELIDLNENKMME